MALLFVYGTLCFPEIIQKLTGESFVSEHAVLKGYQRKSVKDNDYPAIVRKDNSEVKGLLLKDVDERSMEIISFYEGDEYQCSDLEVWTEDKAVKAKVFLWNSNVEALDNFDWNKNEFAKKSLNFYLQKLIPEMLKEFNSHY